MTTLEDEFAYCTLRNLTWAGHDFADSIHTPFVWNEWHEEMKKKGLLGVAFSVMKESLDKLIRKKLEAAE